MKGQQITQYIFHQASKITLVVHDPSGMTIVFVNGVSTHPENIPAIAHWAPRFMAIGNTYYAMLEAEPLRSLLDDLTRALGPCETENILQGDL